MNKLLKIGFGVLLVAVLAIGLFGTGAWFSSQVQSTNNSLTAATLSLTANGGSGTTQSYVLTNLKPGDWAPAGQVIAQNTGSIPGHLWFEVVNISPASSLLGNLVYPKFERNAAPWGISYGPGTTNLNGYLGLHIDVQDLNPGDSVPVFLYVNWPSTANDNSAQGASLTFNVVWHLDQIH